MFAKLRNMASLSFLVYAKDIPSEVSLRDCSLKYEGAQKGRDDLVAGVYGTYSKQMALVCAANWSRERAHSSGVNRILMLDVNYRVDNYDLTRSQVRKETLEQTGWLHLDRVSTKFRDELKAEWLSWVDAAFTKSALKIAEDQTLTEIVQKYPRFIARMFDERPYLRGVVHPVRATIDPSIVLWAATVRYEADRFEDATVRFLPQVKVVV